MEGKLAALAMAFTGLTPSAVDIKYLKKTDLNIT